MKWLNCARQIRDASSGANRLIMKNKLRRGVIMLNLSIDYRNLVLKSRRKSSQMMMVIGNLLRNVCLMLLKSLRFLRILVREMCFY